MVETEKYFKITFYRKTDHNIDTNTPIVWRELIDILEQEYNRVTGS